MVNSAPLRAFARLILTRRILHYDDKVLQVNDYIAVMAGWPLDPNMHPHFFARLLRHCVAMLCYVIRKSKEAISPINLWFKQHIIYSLSQLVKGMSKFTLTAFGRVKVAFSSLPRHLKHLHFKNFNVILRDIELGDNRISEGTNVASEGVSQNWIEL